MPSYLLDTDITTLLRGGHPVVLARSQAVPATDIGVSVVTVEEQLTGWYTYLRKARRPDQVEKAYRELAETVRFFAQVRVVDFDAAAIARYQTLQGLKLNVGRYDLKIAAIALEVGTVVVTRNVRDFGRVPNLAVEDWTQPAPSL